MTITLDTRAYCKLVEGGWYGSHLTDDILEKAIVLWWHYLSTDERRAVYKHFRTKELETNAQKRLLQEHLLARYCGQHDYVVTHNGEEHQVYRVGEHLHLSPTVRVNMDKALGGAVYQRT